MNVCLVIVWWIELIVVDWIVFDLFDWIMFVECYEWCLLLMLMNVGCRLEYCDECTFVGRDDRDFVKDGLIVCVIVLCLCVWFDWSSVCYVDEKICLIEFLLDVCLIDVLIVVEFDGECFDMNVWWLLIDLIDLWWYLMYVWWLMLDLLCICLIRLIRCWWLLCYVNVWCLFVVWCNVCCCMFWLKIFR